MFNFIAFKSKLFQTRQLTSASQLNTAAIILPKSHPRQWISLKMSEHYCIYWCTNCSALHYSLLKKVVTLLEDVTTTKKLTAQKKWNHRENEDLFLTNFSNTFPTHMSAKEKKKTSERKRHREWIVDSPCKAKENNELLHLSHAADRLLAASPLYLSVPLSISKFVSLYLLLTPPAIPTAHSPSSLYILIVSLFLFLSLYLSTYWRF